MFDIRYVPMAIMAIGLGLMLVLEQMIPAVAGRAGTIRHAVRNIGLGVLNGIGTGLIATPVLVVMSVWIERNNFGLTQMLEMPWLGLLLFDGWMYIWHRANHEVSRLWRFHRLHHTDTAMDVTTTIRFHPIEILLSTLARLVVMPLLGLTVRELLIYEGLMFPVILLHHSNIRFPEWLDRRLRMIIVTPVVHRIHHSDKRLESDSNYGTILSIWDRVGGTFRLRSDNRPVSFGVSD